MIKEWAQSTCRCLRAQVLALLAATCACGCTSQIRPQVRYLVLGDSITGTIDEDTYPRFLAAELGITVEQIATESAGGQTSATGRGRLERVLQSGDYPDAEVLIYFLGGTEVLQFVRARDPGLAVGPSEQDYPFGGQLSALLDDIGAEVRDSLQLAAQHGLEAMVVTYYELPANKLPCEAFGGNVPDDVEAARANEYLDRLNDVLVNAATEASAAVVDLGDLSDELLADPGNFADCIHPSAAGSARIAEVIAERLRR